MEFVHGAFEGRQELLGIEPLLPTIEPIGSVFSTLISSIQRPFSPGFLYPPFQVLPDHILCSPASLPPTKPFSLAHQFTLHALLFFP